MEEIYLDANATTPVLPQARQAAMAVMGDAFGNPSSIHGSGLKARALMEQVRDRARRLLGAAGGQLCFTSGATEGIQTAVLSALTELRRRRDAGETQQPLLLLYGATEHKAVPEALRHWNDLLGLHWPVRAIPVDHQGRHDLAWLRQQAPQAGLVCTMAANNETGVVSDLDGIRAALAGSTALWLVDSVQALGKLPLHLAERRIDYAPFSGHKLYAPKGIGMLYVREGAPFTPLMTGGGQEGALRAGTENIAGIAALGEVLQALEAGDTFANQETLWAHRERLALALTDAFPGLVFNALPSLCLPTTLNFAVPGLASRLLLDLFDAAGLRVSGGSACSAAKAQPSYVLEAMGLPAWQSSAAVRLSFGAADSSELIERACARIRACGDSLRAHGLAAHATAGNTTPTGLVTRFVADGACCYLVADATRRHCVLIDALPAHTEQITQWQRRHHHTLVAVLATTHRTEHAASVAALSAAFPESMQALGPADPLGWPQGARQIELGHHRITRLAPPGGSANAAAYVLHTTDQGQLAFVGAGAMADAGSLHWLTQALAPQALLLPGHDDAQHFAWTLGQPSRLKALHAEPEALTLSRDRLHLQFSTSPAPLLVDVREPYEHALGGRPDLGQGVHPNNVQSVPLGSLLNALPAWLKLEAGTPVLFYCRSGNRSAQAARALRRLGHANAWSLEGGLALWAAQATPATLAR